MNDRSATEAEKQSRLEAIQMALQEAALLPLSVAEHCLTVMQLAVQVISIGSVNAASDAAVSGLMAQAALQGALYNVQINLNSIKDQDFTSRIGSKVSQLRKEAAEVYQTLMISAGRIIG